jgi:hypothetical protein
MERLFEYRSSAPLIRRVEISEGEAFVRAKVVAYLEGNFTLGRTVIGGEGTIEVYGLKQLPLGDPKRETRRNSFRPLIKEPLQRGEISPMNEIVVTCLDEVLMYAFRGNYSSQGELVARAQELLGNKDELARIILSHVNKSQPSLI